MPEYQPLPPLPLRREAATLPFDRFSHRTAPAHERSRVDSAKREHPRGLCAAIAVPVRPACLATGTPA